MRQVCVISAHIVSQLLELRRYRVVLTECTIPKLYEPRSLLFWFVLELDLVRLKCSLWPQHLCLEMQMWQWSKCLLLRSFARIIVTVEVGVSKDGLIFLSHSFPSPRSWHLQSLGIPQIVRAQVQVLVLISVQNFFQRVPQWLQLELNLLLVIVYDEERLYDTCFTWQKFGRDYQDYHCSDHPPRYKEAFSLGALAATKRKQLYGSPVFRSAERVTPLHHPLSQRLDQRNSRAERPLTTPRVFALIW